MAKFLWLGLQLFGGEGGSGGTGSAGSASGDGGGTAAPGETTAPAAGESRLRELGVPESVLQKRANRAKKSSYQPAVAQQKAEKDTEPTQQAAAAEPTTTPTEESKPDEPAAARMSWDEIMADPEYNKQMQSTIQARLKSAKSAEENLGKLAPAIELLTRKYGLDPKNLDADALTKAISDDNSYYEDKALEMGVPVETAKKIDQMERENERRQEEEARTIEQQKYNQSASLYNNAYKTFCDWYNRTHMPLPARAQFLF